MKVVKLKKILEEAEYNPIEFAPHFYYRAKRRNIDAETVKEKLENHEFVEVRENNWSDPNFQHSYKVTIQAEIRGVMRFLYILMFPDPKYL